MAEEHTSVVCWSAKQRARQQVYMLYNLHDDPEYYNFAHMLVFPSVDSLEFLNKFMLESKENVLKQQPQTLLRIRGDQSWVAPHLQVTLVRIADTDSECELKQHPLFAWSDGTLSTIVIADDQEDIASIQQFITEKGSHK